MKKSCESNPEEVGNFQECLDVLDDNDETVLSIGDGDLSVIGINWK